MRYVLMCMVYLSGRACIPCARIQRCISSVRVAFFYYTQITRVAHCRRAVPPGPQGRVCARLLHCPAGHGRRAHPLQKATRRATALRGVLGSGEGLARDQVCVCACVRACERACAALARNMRVCIGRCAASLCAYVAVPITSRIHCVPTNICLTFYLSPLFFLLSGLPWKRTRRALSPPTAWTLLFEPLTCSAFTWPSWTCGRTARCVHVYARVLNPPYHAHIAH